MDDQYAEALANEAKRMDNLQKLDEKSRLRNGASTLEVAGTPANREAQKQGMRIRPSESK